MNCLGKNREPEARVAAAVWWALERTINPWWLVLWWGDTVLSPQHQLANLRLHQRLEPWIREPWGKDPGNTGHLQLLPRLRFSIIFTFPYTTVDWLITFLLKVPSNYASNYPLGHSRRERNSQSGYGTLPMPHTENSRMSMNQSPYNAPVQNTPQVGTVHPLPHGQHGSATYAPGSVSGASIYAPGLERQRSYSNPRKNYIILIVLLLLLFWMTIIWI